MLAHGRRHAERVGTEFPALVGDIERLPFKNGTFDTVVSITVLRHFPLWETILDEYLRVIRPGGRLIFDMGSGDQRAFLAGRGVELPDREGLGTRPLDYDAALTMSQLIELAQARNMRILTTFPADVFLSNDLLDHVLGDAAEAFRDHVAAHLHDARALAFLDFMLRNFVRHLSPALSGSWLMVLGKSPPPRPYAPAYDAIRPGAAGEDAAARLMATLRSCCGPAFDARARQAQAYLDFPCNHQLLKIFREELAPWLPAEALTFRA